MRTIWIFQKFTKSVGLQINKICLYDSRGRDSQHFGAGMFLGKFQWNPSESTNWAWLRSISNPKSVHACRQQRAVSPIGSGRGGAGGALAPPPPTFLQMVFFLHANARHSKPKVASRCRHIANIAFDLFNIFLYVIARKVRKCPLSPFVTSNVVFSCLVRMADILARLT